MSKMCSQTELTLVLTFDANIACVQTNLRYCIIILHQRKKKKKGKKKLTVEVCLLSVMSSSHTSHTNYMLTVKTKGCRKKGETYMNISKLNFHQCFDSLSTHNIQHVSIYCEYL